jgi:benzoyl-CoA-dihydrodiol lyase
LAKTSRRPAAAKGIALTPLKRRADASGVHYEHIEAIFDRSGRSVTITIRAPHGDEPATRETIHAAGASWWPLALARELDDLILTLRINELDLGLWVLKTTGDANAVLSAGRTLAAHRDFWLVRETVGFLRRTFARLDVTARSLYAVIDQGSCFAGLLFEIALAADRSYMLSMLEGEGEAPAIALDDTNFGLFPMLNGQTRLATRFLDQDAKIEQLRTLIGQPLTAEDALRRGLVTLAPDDLDWEDEIRLALEERASLSPDALIGMEANLRFAGPETLATKIFARLSAWQNWVFYRPNATGERGALKVFGTGSKPQFDWERV